MLILHARHCKTRPLTSIAALLIAALCGQSLFTATAAAEQREAVENTISEQPLPEAENIDLKQVVAPPATERDPSTDATLPPLVGPLANPVEPSEPEPESEPQPQPQPEGEPGGAAPDSAVAETTDSDATADTAPQPEEQPQPDPLPVAAAEQPMAFVGPPVPDDLGSITLLGSRVPPRTSTRLEWSPSVSFAGIAVPTPVLIVNGAAPGPVLCLTAAIHGDELNGIEVVRRLIYQLDVEKLKGAVIGVPIVNLQGFQRGSRYLADRRDLNRHFPGNPRGSVASRIAHSFFEEVIDNCDALVDVHTGSFHRTNLPQVRADLHRPEVKAMSQKFGATVVLHTPGGAGTLRRAATDAGIPAVTIEAGEPMRLQENEVNHGVKSLRSLLDQMGMYSRFSLWGNPEPVYYESVWIRADAGGILLSNVKLGAQVSRNTLLGTVVDPITNAKTEIRAPFAGRILGMAVNQVVMPGYAAYHVGVRAEPANLPVEPLTVEGETDTRLPEPVRQPPGDELEDSEE